MAGQLHSENQEARLVDDEAAAHSFFGIIHSELFCATATLTYNYPDKQGTASVTYGRRSRASCL